MKKLDKELLLSDKIMHPVIASHITDAEFKSLPLRSFEQILQEENKDKQNVFRTRFCVEGVIPGSVDVTQLVKIYNKKTNKTREINEKVPLKKDEQLMFYM